MRNSAAYVRPNANIRDNRVIRMFFAAICIILAMSFGTAASISALNRNSSISTVNAAPDPHDILNKAVQAGGVDTKSNDGFTQALDKGDGAGIYYTISRLFGIRYLNDTPDAVTKPNAKKNPENCDPNPVLQTNKNQTVSIKDSVLYHNCDIPNFLTEVVQDVYADYMTSGVSGGEKQSVKSWLGVPSNIPNNEVDPDPAQRTAKYTALELFGYNMRFTSYYGEWDHIKVMNSARLMSNYGFMDKLRVGGTAVWRAGTTGLQNGASESWQSLKHFDLLGAGTGFIRGYVSGAAAATINTLTDESDYNVFNSNAWYRVDFSRTVYNVRELSQAEIADILKARVAESVNAKITKNAPAANQTSTGLPDNFTAIENPPVAPANAISSCVTTKTHTNIPALATDSSSGITEDECNQQAQSMGQKAVWQVDGKQKAQSVSNWYSTTYNTWLKKVQSFQADANYKGIVDISQLPKVVESNKESSYSTFSLAWKSIYKKASPAVAKKYQSIQESKNVGKTVDTGDSLQNLENGLSTALADATSQLKQFMNFNAPYSRYVCVDNKGEDILNNTKPASSIDHYYTFAYDSSGNRNPACGEIRPPIQNGLFGNGYDANQQVQPDTRFTAYSKSAALMRLLFANSGLNQDSIGNFGMKITSAITAATVEIVDLSYTPVLQKLGFDKIIASTITTFRDSVFFPFSVMVVGISALMTMISSFRRGNVGAAIRKIATMLITFFVCTFIMLTPKTFITLSDTVPAEIEQGLVAGIFSLTPDAHADELCTATKTSTATTNGNDGFTPSDETRTMECEVWRAFDFTPWVHGQWGTAYDNLYASDQVAIPTRMTNTDGDLVGDAAVPMGNSTTENNWALYQLQTMAEGTITTTDPTVVVGKTNNNIYRMVDLQAGPENGAGRDDEFFNSWSGGGYQRFFVGLFSPIVSVLGMFAVSLLALPKIELSLLMGLLFLFFPFYALFGLYMDAGNVRLKKYGMTILSYEVQRIVLVAMLAVLLKIMTSMVESSPNYLLSAIVTSIICLVFIKNRKSVMGMVESAFGVTGSVLSAASVGGNARRKMSASMPKGIKSYSYRVGAETRGAVAGAAAGFVNDGFKGAGKGARESMKINKNRAERRQMALGLGMFQGLNRSRELGADTVRDDNGNRALPKKDNKKLVNEKRDDIASTASVYTKRLESVANNPDQLASELMKPVGRTIPHKQEVGVAKNEPTTHINKITLSPKTMIMSVGIFDQIAEIEKKIKDIETKPVEFKADAKNPGSRLDTSRDRRALIESEEKTRKINALNTERERLYHEIALREISSTTGTSYQDLRND